MPIVRKIANPHANPIEAQPLETVAPTTNGSRPSPAIEGAEWDVLPEGWEWTTLGKVLARIEAGRSPKNRGRPAQAGEFGVLKVSAVTWGEFRAAENKAMLPGDVPEPHTTVHAGDLLISRANTIDLIGAVVLVDKHHPHLMLSDKTLRLVPASEDISPAYLLYALRTPLARDFFAAHATGTSDSMRNISQEKIGAVPIPLPPAAEQRRIVDRIEALLAQARTARQALDGVPELIKQFRQSVLSTAFAGRLTEREPGDDSATELLEQIRAERMLLGGRRTNGDGRKLAARLPELPKGWEWVTLGQILADIEAGRSPKNKGRLAQSGEYGVLKVSAITWGRFLPNENKALLDGSVPEPDMTVRVGDLLITRANTTDLIGAVVLVDQDYPHLMLSDKTLRLIPASADIPRQYLLYALRTQMAREFLAANATGTSDSMRNISQEKIGATPLPLAPLAEQRRIVARIEALFAQADALDAAVAAARARLAQADQAILARAFRGELVEQDPNDEPAGALLERIRRARSATGSNDEKKGRRRGPVAKDESTAEYRNLTFDDI